MIVASASPAQLGTAKIPRDVDLAAFGGALYQWASTITLSGQNLPFALPQKVDKTATGFKVRAWASKGPWRRMSFLMQGASGSFESIGEIEAAVEKLDDGTPVLFIRGYGKAAENSLVDVPIVMGLMPTAIKAAVMNSRRPSS